MFDSLFNRNQSTNISDKQQEKYQVIAEKKVLNPDFSTKDFGRL
jgi:hypothetical protein